MSASTPVNGASTGLDAAVVLSSMAVGYVALDRHWRMTQVNAAAAAILGEPADVLVGRDLWQQYPGARELDFGRVYESVMTTRQPASFDAFYPGLGVWFEVRVQPTEDGIAVYFLDITARKSADRRAAEAAERTRLATEVTESLGASLDVQANVAQLARLVVPYLGTWSIVTLADEQGVLVDESCWHVDPARREDVRRYMRARLAALPGTIAEEAITSGRAVALMSGAHQAVRARLRHSGARELFDVLAPDAAAVVPMIARGRTIGVLSIYSDTPWTEHQVDVAKDVAARAALSLDNSLAYTRARAAREDAEAARAEAEAAGQRLSLLARVSNALAGTADADEAVGQLARLVVPHLADWSLVTIVDDDQGVRNVAVAHRDPARAREVAAYGARRSLTMTPLAPLAVALRTGEAVVVADVDDTQIREPQHDPAVVQLAQGLEPHGVAVIPLIAAGRTFGALTLVTTRARGPHTDDELAAALEVADRAGPVLESARAAHRARRLAESVQRSMLMVLPPRPGLEIAARYRPAQVDNEVGGDWYDHFELPDGSTVLTIGDVMGHDTAAIAAMAQLRTFMRATAWAGRHTPAGVLTDTDSASRTLGPGVFATAITGELAAPTPDGSVTLRWSNAGHLAPALISGDGVVSYLRTPVVDVPLGVVAGAERHDHTVTLPQGSTLLLFTDGLVERRDRDIDEGLDELSRVLTSAHGRDLDRTLDRTLIGMRSDEPYQDDIAVLAVRVVDPHRPDDAGDDVLGDLLGSPIRVILPPDATAPRAARDVLARNGAGLSADVLADAALLVSELASNALRHGLPPFTVEAHRTDAQLRVSLSDVGALRPDLPTRPPPPNQPSGRGLIILDTVSHSWGVTASATDAGKTVWFTLPLD